MIKPTFGAQLLAEGNPLMVQKFGTIVEKMPHFHGTKIMIDQYKEIMQSQGLLK
jgi:ascorbate-specific PTS system EIIC-type component UlaA